MHLDTVRKEKLAHNPKFLLLLLIVAASSFYYLNPFKSILEAQSGSFIGVVQGNPVLERVAVALLLGVGFVANMALIGMLPKRAQIGAVWAELALLFLGFFYLFDLSLEFIESKLWFLISQGVTTTLSVSAISIVIATFIALVGAIAKLSQNAFAFAIASFYTSLFRGIPLLMQVYLIYIGLPQLGYVVDAVPAGVAALSLCYGAYMTEIFRAGIQSIPRGQWEASRALGLRPFLTMRKIVLPQALPLVIPPIGNQFIAMLKDSSLVSVIGVWELMYLARTTGNQTFQHMEMLITAAVIYWILTIALELTQSRIEKHFRKSEAR